MIQIQQQTYIKHSFTHQNAYLYTHILGSQTRKKDSEIHPTTTHESPQ